MKEALICFAIALVIGAMLNGTKQLDVWGSTSVAGAPASQVIPAVTESTFQHEVLESEQPVLVDFYTEECPHCTAMVPIVAEVAGEMKGSVKVVRVDSGENASVADKYGVNGVPDFVMFKEGQKLENITGERSKSELLSFVKKCAAEKVDSSGEATPRQSNSQDSQLPTPSGNQS
jgi:thioredoxin 1